MDELKDIYDRITYLRHKGMKMKDIAALVDFQPSVFSALYTTVIPAFVKNTARGMAPAEALDGALVWVNNVSKRRLLASLPSRRPRSWPPTFSRSRCAAAGATPMRRLSAA